MIATLFYLYLAGIVAVAFVRTRFAFLSVFSYIAFALAAVPFVILDPTAEQAGVKLQIFAIVGAAAYPLIARERWRYRNLLFPYSIALAAFLALLAIYLGLSGFYPYGVEKVMFFCFRAALMMCALSLLGPFGRHDCYVICGTIVFASFLLGVTALQFADINVSRSDVEGTIGPITISRLIGLGVFLCLVNLMDIRAASLVTAPFLSLATIILLHLSVVTGSRGPLFAGAASFAFVFLLSRHLNIVARGFVLAGIVFLLMFAFSVTAGSELSTSLGFNRILYLFQEGTLGTSELARYYLTSAALTAFLDSNGLGVGTGGFAAWLGEEREWPHNLIMEILCELGIPGIVVFVVIFSITVKQWLSLVGQGRKLSAIELALASVWIYFLLNSLVSYDIAANFHLWISLSLPWFIGRRQAAAEPELENLSEKEVAQ